VLALGIGADTGMPAQRLSAAFFDKVVMFLMPIIFENKTGGIKNVDEFKIIFGSIVRGHEEKIKKEK
jgi:hypothetical protein